MKNIEINAGLRFEPFNTMKPQFDLSFGLSKLSPELIMVIGSALLAVGFYLHHQKNQQKEV